MLLRSASCVMNASRVGIDCGEVCGLDGLAGGELVELASIPETSAHLGGGGEGRTASHSTMRGTSSAMCAGIRTTWSACRARGVGG